MIIGAKTFFGHVPKCACILTSSQFEGKIVQQWTGGELQSGGLALIKKNALLGVLSPFGKTKFSL